MYNVVVLNIDKEELGCCYEIATLREAKIIAREYLSDPEYVIDGYKVEVINSDTGECAYDVFYAST